MSFTGYKILWGLYSKRNLCKGISRAVLWVIPILYAFVVSDVSMYERVGMISSLVVTSFPSLIGFVLAGYAILIGCAGSSFIHPMFIKDKKTGISHFQKISATFGMVMIGLIITFLAAFIIRYIFELQCRFPFHKGDGIFNGVITVVLSFMAVYSIWSLCDITVNIFNFSQFINKNLTNCESKKDISRSDDGNG